MVFFESIKKCPCCLIEFKTKKIAKKFCSSICQVKHSNGNPTYNAEKYKERKKNPEWIKNRYEKDRQRHKKVKIFLREYKMSKGCAECGYIKHHSALQFDHVRGEKLIDVCFAKSIEQAKKEIEKCEVVCANCHSIRTFERRTNTF